MSKIIEKTSGTRLTTDRIASTLIKKTIGNGGKVKTLLSETKSAAKVPAPGSVPPYGAILYSDGGGRILVQNAVFEGDRFVIRSALGRELYDLTPLAAQPVVVDSATWADNLAKETEESGW